MSWLAIHMECVQWVAIVIIGAIALEANNNQYVEYTEENESDDVV